MHVDAAPSLLAELRVILALAALFWLPGAALLTIAGLRSRWSAVNEAIVTIGLSIALPPVLFYGLRFWLPNFRTTPVAIGLFLLLCALFAYGHLLVSIHKFSFLKFTFHEGEDETVIKRLRKIDWAFLLIVLLTITTRLWVAHQRPIPAWTDSLHHVLITQLTIQNGQIPFDLEPYNAIPLAMYHLGLYTLTAPIALLTNVSAHVAVQWTAQALNGLAGIGVYLVIERYTKQRIGALLGAATVGLFCHMPAYYVNWGRFTQIAGQSILLIGWFVVLESLRQWTRSADEDDLEQEPLSWRQQIGFTFIAAIFSASIFLLHFRVAAIYVILLCITVPYSLWLAYRNQKFWFAFLYLTAIGALALLFVLPALWSALETYVAFRQAPPLIADPQINAHYRNSYNNFPLSSIPTLAARPWLLYTAGISAAIGLWRRNWLAVTTLFWALLLIGLGNMFRLGIPMLNITNLGMILIMLYMPIGILMGVAMNEVWAMLPERYERSFVRLFLAMLIVGAGVSAWYRISEIEEPRFFVKNTDLAAMDWIRQNTQPDDIFAVNADYWQAAAVNGEDAGYWIPYFTNQRTTAPPMIMHLADRDERLHMLELINGVIDFEEDPTTLNALYDLGVNYVYVRRSESPLIKGLRLEEIQQAQSLDVVYHNQDVQIVRLIDRSTEH